MEDPTGQRSSSTVESFHASRAATVGDHGDERLAVRRRGWDSRTSREDEVIEKLRVIGAAAARLVLNARDTARTAESRR